MLNDEISRFKKGDDYAFSNIMNIIHGDVYKIIGKYKIPGLEKSDMFSLAMEAVLDCLKDNGQFINCDYIALTQEIEDEQLYELEHKFDEYKHIDIPMTIAHEFEVLNGVGFQDITSSSVDKHNYSLIKARKIK